MTAQIWYTTYDGSERHPAGVKDSRPEHKWIRLYVRHVYKAIYPNYQCWLDDMLRHGILTKEIKSI